MSDVKAQAKTAQDTGARVVWDMECGRCEVFADDGSTMFKALRKGEAGEPWLVMYNPAFYPRDEAERMAAVDRVTAIQAKKDRHCGYFFVSADGARVLGADGVERTGADKVAIVNLSKFADMRAVMAFVRWAEVRLSRWKLQSMTQA